MARTPTPIEEAIESLNRAWDDAFNRGDAAALADLYADDARLLTPTRTVAAGKEQVKAYWQQLIDHGWHGHAWEGVETAGSGETAWQTGRWRALGHGKGGEDVAGEGLHAGNLMALYRADQGGWRISRHIWN
jgi:uncharacterized protein (TIGR02246 family)